MQKTTWRVMWASAHYLIVSWYGPWTKQMPDEESTYVHTGKFKATSVKQIMK